MQIIAENKNGNQWNLSIDRDVDVTHVSGLTPQNATIYTSTLSSGDGDVYNRSRANARNIVITLRPRGAAEKCRLKIYQYFKLKQYIKLYFRTNSRNVYIEGYIDNMDGDLYENGQKIQVSIICPYPYFKDVADNIISFASVIPMFSFPFAIEEAGIVFSDQSAIIEKSLINTGDDTNGVIIMLEATGKIVEPAIFNKTTRESFILQVEMQVGDKITINSHRGQKSVILLRDGEETNIVNKILLPSQWPTLAIGDNVITYTCAFGLEDLYITFMTNNIYGGL